MIDEGIYRIYKLRHADDGSVGRRMWMRVFIHDGQVQHLEDHDNAQRFLPEGPMTPHLSRRLEQLQHSPYFEVIHERDLGEGMHAEHVAPLELGEITPDHKFVMTGPSLPNPQILELWGEAVVLDGRRLDENEAHQLLSEVGAGRLSLTPV
jgi:hypothetical protein